MTDRNVPPLHRPPRLVLFDLDDTLCDYSAARLGRLRLAFAGPGREPPLVDGDLLERMVAASVARQPHGSDHFADLFDEFHAGTANDALEAARWFRANRFHGLALFPEAMSVVAAVRALGATTPIGLGIVTNGPAEVQREKVRLLGVEPLVDFVIVSGEFGVAKPDPAIFEEALRRGNAAAADTIVVGDSLAHDIAGAEAIGARSIWINRAGIARAEDDPAPDAETSSIAAVPGVLRAMVAAPARPVRSAL